MRSCAIVFTRRAKLEAFSAGLNWFVRRNGNQPLRLTHASSYGDFDLMSDGKKIQLSWWPTDSSSDSTSPKDHAHDEGNTRADHPYPSDLATTLHCTSQPETQRQQVGETRAANTASTAMASVVTSHVKMTNTAPCTKTTITGGSQTIDAANRKRDVMHSSSGGQTLTAHAVDPRRTHDISSQANKEMGNHINDDADDGVTAQASVKVISATSEQSRPVPTDSSVGALIGDDLGDTVADIFDDIINSVVDDVSEQVLEDCSHRGESGRQAVRVKTDSTPRRGNNQRSRSYRFT